MIKQIVSYANVAAVSPVPIMLDEPICTIGDEKCGKYAGEALAAVRNCGMEPVLGDGLGTELSCGMEACIATTAIRNAGEFNGFLKPRLRLFAEPLRFAAGELTLSVGFRPMLDRDVMRAHEMVRERNAVLVNAQR